MDGNTNPDPGQQTSPASDQATPDNARREAAAAMALGQAPNPNETAAIEPPVSGFRKVAGVFGGVIGFAFSWFIFPILIVLILHNFVFQAYHVVGTSMVNTLHPTDYLIISKIGSTKAWVGKEAGKNSIYIPARGQIIVFHYPKQPDLIFVKRVIALPGERVTVQDGVVTVYNQAHPSGFQPDSLGSYEPQNTVTLGQIDETVASDSVFVLGDNRTPGGSFDSRDWGELPSSYIIGNAVLRLLPLDKITTF